MTTTINESYVETTADHHNTVPRRWPAVWQPCVSWHDRRACVCRWLAPLHTAVPRETVAVSVWRGLPGRGASLLGAATKRVHNLLGFIHNYHLFTLISFICLAAEVEIIDLSKNSCDGFRTSQV